MDFPTHIEIAKNPDSWRQKAFTFKETVDVLINNYKKSRELIPKTVGKKITIETMNLFKGVGVQLPCLVLMGYSIENLLKASQVKKDPSVVNDRDRLPWAHHKLANHCDNVGFRKTENDLLILNRLTDSIVWGKYPTKIRPSEYSKIDGKIKYHPHVSFDIVEFYDQFLDLFDRLNKFFERID